VLREAIGPQPRQRPGDRVGLDRTGHADQRATVAVDAAEHRRCLPGAVEQIANLAFDERPLVLDDHHLFDAVGDGDHVLGMQVHT
jgi:hypothetical protein